MSESPRLSDPRPNVCLEELFMQPIVFEHIFEYKACAATVNIPAGRADGGPVSAARETIGP